MNKKLLIGAVVVGLVVIGVVAMGLKKGSVQNLIMKEISVGTDVCGEFPKEWVASVIKKTVIKTEKLGTSGLNVCQYYIDENNFVTLRLNDLSFEDQKKGQETLGRSITSNDRIPLNHFIAMQGDNVINDIVLEINPNLFLAVDRSSLAAANETEIVDFAVSVAQRIQKGENVAAPSATLTTQAAVGLPQGEDIVRNFFALINEGKISDAVNMLSSNNQAWNEQLAAFKKVSVKSIEPAGENMYKVVLDVEMKPESEQGPIPFYGYEKGENIRWVGVEKVDTLWKVTGIATGP